MGSSDFSTASWLADQHPNRDIELRDCSFIGRSHYEGSQVAEARYDEPVLHVLNQG